MVFNRLPMLIALHVGTPVEISQATLTLMLVVLGTLLLGVGYGLLAKNKDGLKLHRWSMSVAIVLACIAIFLVMLPSAFRFYIDPDVEFYSSLSIFTIIHGIMGVPTIALGLIYALGDLPKKTKHWMRWTAVLWVVSIVLGGILYLDMLGLLSISMPMQLAQLSMKFGYFL
ncbi:MAG: DUF420 domain-containing protein [Candidatus Bathyarchaeota archaeon]|nr:DUF420 domain-containing protein [Candidatus Bathyarchaeota archaeon]